MNKKRLGNDPLDDLDILKGPEKRDNKTAGEMTSEMTSKMTGKMTSHTAGSLDIPAKSKLKKMTYYFRQDQLKEIDKLSKRTGRDRSELARMAFDLLIESVKKK